jgi:hypothetical protein
MWLNVAQCIQESIDDTKNHVPMCILIGFQSNLVPFLAKNIRLIFLITCLDFSKLITDQLCFNCQTFGEIVVFQLWNIWLRFHEGTLNLCLHFLGSQVAWKTMHFLPTKSIDNFWIVVKCLAKSLQPVHSQTSISCTCKIPSISSYNCATLWAQKVWKMRLNGLKAQDAIVPSGGLAKHYNLWLRRIAISILVT